MPGVIVRWWWCGGGVVWWCGGAVAAAAAAAAVAAVVVAAVLAVAAVAFSLHGELIVTLGLTAHLRDAGISRLRRARVGRAIG